MVTCQRYRSGKVRQTDAVWRYLLLIGQSSQRTPHAANHHRDTLKALVETTILIHNPQCRSDRLGTHPQIVAAQSSGRTPHPPQTTPISGESHRIASTNASSADERRFGRLISFRRHVNSSLAATTAPDTPDRATAHFHMHTPHDQVTTASTIFAPKAMNGSDRFPDFMNVIFSLLKFVHITTEF